MRIKTRITKARMGDDVLRVASFLKKWPGRSLTITDMIAVKMFATWKGKLAQVAFATAYSKQPDLVAALLVHLTAVNNPKTATGLVRRHFDEYLFRVKSGKLIAATEGSIQFDKELADLMARDLNNEKITRSIVRDVRQEKSSGAKSEKFKTASLKD